MSKNGPLRVGIGGPVGSGKTTLVEKLCKHMRDRWSVAVVTNDIYTQEDALILNRLQALAEDRILGVETGGCPHTAIREDASLNLAAIAEMNRRHPDLDVIFIESGGDNLAATFSPDLADLTIYVISVCQGEKIPRKGGPAITRSDLLVINKTDLAPHVGADLEPIRQAEQPAELCLVIGNQRHPVAPDHVVAAREGSAGEIRVGPDTEDLGRIPEGGAGERVVGVQ